jgi:UDP-glucose 4-epimerase
MSTTNKNVLVTGGAGYIGSHTCLELVDQGYKVVAVDNLANGNCESLQRVEEATGAEIAFHEVDLRDENALGSVFKAHPIDSVIHFAGYKAVGESVEEPLLYYSNNVSASVTLLKMMGEYGVDNIVFSSSCTVYGKPDSVPVVETDRLAPTNPYGRSKLMVERILQDSFQAIPSLSVSILRYFNPIGAHPSGRIGEDPTGIPNNLLPYVSRVAAGKLEELQVFGDDYDTHDGTGVRDYIHVVDLAKAHIAALEELLNDSTSICKTYNLGTGRGYSVLDVVKAFEEVSGQEVPYQITARRSGDVGKTFADPTKANRQLGWSAQKSLKEMCQDMWNWQQQNQNGYSN